MTDAEIVTAAIDRSARAKTLVRLVRPTQGQIDLLVKECDDVDAIQGDDGRVIGWEFIGGRRRKWSVYAYDKDGIVESPK